MDKEKTRVVAESVGDRWTSILTKDSLGLTAIYLEEDRNGKVRAWNDTDSENASELYLQQLETLEVKAGLVAPIANVKVSWQDLFLVFFFFLGGRRCFQVAERQTRRLYHYCGGFLLVVGVVGIHCHHDDGYMVTR